MPHANRRQFLALTAGWLGACALPAWAKQHLPSPLGRHQGNWVTTWNEDFRDRRRFAQDWIAMTNIGDNTSTLRQPANVGFSTEGLELELGDNTGPQAAQAPYTGGYIRSKKFRQRFGYFECDMRIADEAGVNNAFWLVSDPDADLATTFELDVVEGSYPSAIQASARQWAPERKVVAQRLEFDVPLADSFHRFGLLWSPTQFAFSFDDELYFAAPNTFAHTAAEIRFSNAVADFAGVTDGAVAGAATTICRMRIFQNSSWT